MIPFRNHGKLHYYTSTKFQYLVKFTIFADRDALIFNLHETLRNRYQSISVSAISMK